ncbi:MAG: outer membrane beta-barrel protein [Bdellovibrionales bacterium]
MARLYRFLSLSCCIVLTLISFPKANAEFLVEPYAGYHMGTWKTTSPSHDLNGISYGLRLGYLSSGFMVGADYMLGKWSDDVTPTSNDWEPKDLALFFGYNFPTLVRLYFAYAFDAEAELTASGSSSKYSGTGVKFGVGFRVVPLVSINLEMIRDTYDEVNGNNLSTDLKTNMYGVTVSFPFEL